MDALTIILISCIALGVLVGFLAGLLGIGGGLLIVPSLLFLFANVLNISTELAMPMAIATSLSTVIFTGMSSARSHYRMGNLPSELLLVLGVTIAVGATLGAMFASTISGLVLKRIFAVLVMLIAAQMVFYKPKPSTLSTSNTALASIGGSSGFIASLMGIGGGALIVPALVWFNVNIKKAIGCASFCGILIAVFGTVSFVFSGYNVVDLPKYSLGYVYLPATLGIVITSVFFAPIGAKLTNVLDTAILKRIFAVFLVLVSIRMIIGIE